MTLYLYDLDNCRETNFIENNIVVIEIENPNYLKKLIFAIKSNIDDAPLAVYDKGKKINLEKDSTFVIDFFQENTLSKSILSKLQDNLLQEDTLEYRVEFGAIVEQINKVIYDIVKNSEIQFSWNQEIEPKDFLKLFALEPLNSQDVLENCLNFVSVCNIMKLYKIIIFYNLKSILSDGDVKKLYKHCLYCRQQVIFLDSQHHEEKLDYEHKIYVDKDLFDIKL